MPGFEHDGYAVMLSSLPDRVALAARWDAAQELLAVPAADEAAPVRLAVADNPCAPFDADCLLVRDPVEAIRVSLARKLAAHAAEMADLVPAPAWDALRLLARDRAQEVRHAVADALTDMPDAPHDLVLDLACDRELRVCEPLIRLSGVLTQEDLLGLVRAPPQAHSRSAVARRLGVDERLADAVVASGDDAAILALLRNPTARLAPATLNVLAKMAARQDGLAEALSRARDRNAPQDDLKVYVIEPSQM